MTPPPQVPHHRCVTHFDHLPDGVDLVRARFAGGTEAEAELLQGRGLDNEVCTRQLLFAQTRIAAMLATIVADHEGRTPQSVLDSLTLALMLVTPDTD